MTLSGATRDRELQELIGELKAQADNLGSVASSTEMVDQLYKLKAKATEAIEFLKGEETLAVDKPVNR
jgi:hypothetical protein